MVVDPYDGLILLEYIPIDMLKLIYYVPESHLESTKLAIFTAGAGGIGDYEHCAWQILGTDQFKPLKGADPFIGEVGELEQVSEWRVETIISEHQDIEVVRAFKYMHSYVKVAFEY